MMSNGRPNLLFVLVDQLRFSSVGYAGMEAVLTPNLDRFAAENANFELAVSNSAVCTPARACILTGRYPLGTTVLTNNSMLPNDMPSLGKILKGEGYSTGYIGKWHLAGEAFIGKTKYNHGQDGYIPPGEMRHGFDYWAVHHCSHNYSHAFYYRDDPEPIPCGKWEPDAQTDLAIDFIQSHTEQAGDDPFALCVSFGTPHTPFDAPREYLELYKPEQITFRENVELSDIMLNCDGRRPENCDTPEEALRINTRNYYASISNIDANFGRLLACLDRVGSRENTIVIFTSDHGEMLGSHGQMHKVQPWDESVRIPFLLGFPEKVGAQTVSIPFNLPDILPTILGFSGVEVPAGVEGRDFSEALIERDETRVESLSAFLVWACNSVTWGKKWSDLSVGARGMPPGFIRPYRGIRTQTHTYVKDVNGAWMLYDNEKDPYQQNNLIETVGPDAVPEELEKELGDWLERTNDVFADSDYYIERIDLETGLLEDPESL